MPRNKKKIPGIYQRGGRWRVDTFYKGQRLKDSFATFEMAEENLRKLKTLIDEGRYLEKKKECKETLEGFAATYFRWCKDTGQKAAKSKQSHLASITNHFGKETLLSKITRAGVENYQAQILSSPSKRKQSIRPATVNRRMACLRHLFSKAVEWKILADNPCKGVKQFKENNRRLRFLSVEECNSLLKAASEIDEDSKRGSCPGVTLQSVIELALNTGMRKQELLKLKWEHVHLKEGYLEILEQKNGEYSTLRLNQAAMEILRKTPRRIDSEYVFTGKIAGQHFVDLKRQFEKAVTNAKLEGVTFHTLRHSAASQMAMNGVDLQSIKEILRHKDYATTLRYAHLSQAHQQAAVDTLGNALKAEGKTEAKTA